jgi:antirestriction protein ArdC
MPNVYEVITERIIKQLESGTAPWHKPWKARGKSGLPRNLVSGREYRGMGIHLTQVTTTCSVLANGRDIGGGLSADLGGVGGPVQQ